MPTHVSPAADVHEELLVAEEFLDWLTPDRHADLLDGKIAVHAPISLRHAKLLNFVDSLLRIHVERFDLGMVFREVVAVRLSSRNVFLPDLAFYHKGRLGLQRDDYIDGAPGLAVEVLSPRTAHRDVGTKFVEYEQHGVEEYWVLDPENPGAPLLCAPGGGAHRIRGRRAGDPLHGAARPAPAPGVAHPRSAAERGRLPVGEHGFAGFLTRQTGKHGRTPRLPAQGRALKPYGNGHREHRAPSEEYTMNGQELSHSNKLPPGWVCRASMTWRPRRTSSRRN